jgi:general secretion pathway protein D
MEVITKKNEDDAASRGGRGGGGGGGGGGEFIGMEGGTTTFERADEKKFFESMGVPFPAGTSVKYNALISKLIVANTPENLEKLEQILAALALTPSQIEIEARFVELNQQDIKELGLEWIFTDNWEIAMNKSGSGPLSTKENISLQADPNGMSKGMNFFHFDSNSGTIVPANTINAATGVNPLGGILSFASVLTNPELQVVLHALDQHGAADLLSAPRVTTRSGVNAQIQVVREIIYPTEFESTQPQFQTGGSSQNGSQVVTPPLVTPGSFETREVGVILNVTPTVGPDGYTIDLVLAPEVSELESWINYGSSFGDFTFNIPQPIFATRKVTTTIVIWDGQTVVMGGLIREALTKVKDKIPFLGDLPLIGRLFRTEGEFSQKKNLVIFVTARLVDPAGKPIHKAEATGAGGSETVPTAPANSGTPTT